MQDIIESYIEVITDQIINNVDDDIDIETQIDDLLFDFVKSGDVEKLLKQDFDLKSYNKIKKTQILKIDNFTLCKNKRCFSYTTGTSVAIIKNRKDKNKRIIKILAEKHLLKDCVGQKIKTLETISPLPNINKERGILYVCGASDCGKTTYSLKYIKNFLDIYKDHDFIVFTQSDDFESYEKFGIKPKVIQIDDSLVENPINIMELKNSIVLFDDVDAIDGKKVRKAIFNLIYKIMKIGRKAKISIIVTYHMVTGGNETRYIIFESQYITLFLEGGSHNQFKNLFKYYLGIDVKKLEDFKKLESRWVTIHKNYPRFMISENEAQII